jgi:hypothetical protein
MRILDSGKSRRLPAEPVNVLYRQTMKAMPGTKRPSLRSSAASADSGGSWGCLKALRG